MTARQWAILGFLALIWGGSFFFAKVAVVEIPPLTIVLVRVSLAAMALYLVLKFSGQPIPKTINIWGGLIIMGLLNNVIPFSLIFWSQTQIPSGLAATLNATTPLFTAVIAHFFTSDEKLTWAKIIGIFAGIGGVGVLVGPDVLSEFDLALTAKFASLLAACTYGCAVVYARYFHKFGLTPLQTAFGQLTTATALMLPIAASLDQFWLLPMPSYGTIAALTALALISTALAYLLFFKLIETSGATNATLVTVLVPVSATLLAVLFLGEHITLAQCSGFILIALGLLTIDGRIFTLLKRS